LVQTETHGIRRIFSKKLRVSMKGELFNSGLNCVEVATRVQRAVATTIATTTSPTKGNTGSLVLPIDATVVQNSVASAVTASSQLQAILYVLRKQVNFSFKKQNSNINLCSPFIKQLCGPVV
jgi:hypothetical protein